MTAADLKEFREQFNQWIETGVRAPSISTDKVIYSQDLLPFQRSYRPEGRYEITKSGNVYRVFPADFDTRMNLKDQWAKARRKRNFEQFLKRFREGKKSCRTFTLPIADVPEGTRLDSFIFNYGYEKKGDVYVFTPEEEYVLFQKIVNRLIDEWRSLPASKQIDFDKTIEDDEVFRGFSHRINGTFLIHGRLGSMYGDLRPSVRTPGFRLKDYEMDDNFSLDENIEVIGRRLAEERYSEFVKEFLKLHNRERMTLKKERLWIDSTIIHWKKDEIEKFLEKYGYEMEFPKIRADEDYIMSSAVERYVEI